MQNNSRQLDQFVKTILQKEEDRTYFNNLVKNTLAGYKQKKSYKEALSTEEYNKVRETTCPYLVEGERDTKKYAELQSIVVKGKDCADKLDSAYVRGMMDGIIDRSESTYNTLTSLEGWKNILSGGCILLYHIALCGNPAAPMSPECLEFFTALVKAGHDYAEGLLQDDCYKRGYAWGEMIVDVLAIKGLEVLATGTIKIAGRVIKAINVESKLVPVIDTTVEGGGNAAKGGTRLISQFSTSTIDDAVSYAMKHKSKHIFDKATHNLNPLVSKLGGRENTVRAVLNAANGKLPSSGIFEDIMVNVEGYNVYIRGRVINGVPKLGTMFIK